MTKEELFKNEHGVALFHDAMLDATGKSLTDEELIEAFDMLPERVQEIAFKWGLSDTAFRDAV